MLPLFLRLIFSFTSLIPLYYSEQGLVHRTFSVNIRLLLTPSESSVMMNACSDLGPFCAGSCNASLFRLRSEVANSIGFCCAPISISFLAYQRLLTNPCTRQFLCWGGFGYRYSGVLLKWQFYIKLWAACFAPSFPSKKKSTGVRMATSRKLSF